MGMPAARVTDMHTCPMVTGLVPHVGGPILPPAAVTVLTGGLPQARVGDMAVCVGPPDVIAMGASTVLVCGQPAARIGDITAHGGVIVAGLPTVLIGNDSGGGAAAAAAGDAAGAAAAVPILAEGKDTLAGAMAKVMVEAAKEGKPFCEQCTRAALAAQGYK